MEVPHITDLDRRREGIFFQSRNQAAIEAGLRFVGRSADGQTRYALPPEQKDAARRRFAGLIQALGYEA